MAAMVSANASSEPLTKSTIFRFYRPLAFSWLLMAIEAPIAVAILARRPEAELNTASFLLMMSLALWIESPVIDLLSTSTTLAKDGASVKALRRFMLQTAALVTAVHFVIVFTPLYDIVTRNLLHIPQDVADRARVGLYLLLFWSACIGWRRYLQGILIRFGQTRSVGHGTIVRLVSLTTSGILLHLFTEISGIAIVGFALGLSVFSEAAYIHFAARPVLRQIHESPSDSQLDTRRLIRFHWPLTATTMLVLIANLFVSQSLALSPESKTAMAAWQVSATLVWLMRTVTYALPEAVIALYRDEESRLTLKRFCWNVGIVTTICLVVIGLTRVDVWFFARVLKAEPQLLDSAHIAFLLCALLPLIGALQSYVRGMLTAYHLTRSRLWAIAVGLTSLLGVLQVGVWARWPGVVTAAVALSFSLLAELCVLVLAWNRRPQVTA